MRVTTLGVFVLAVMTAQEQDGVPPKFEVASIKSGHDTSPETWVMEDQSGNFTTHNATLKRMILFAYGVREHQVIGGPSWLDSARFDILPNRRREAGVRRSFVG